MRDDRGRQGPIEHERVGVADPKHSAGIVIATIVMLGVIFLAAIYSDKTRQENSSSSLEGSDGPSTLQVE